MGVIFRCSHTFGPEVCFAAYYFILSGSLEIGQYFDYYSVLYSSLILQNNRDVLVDTMRHKVKHTHSQHRELV